VLGERAHEEQAGRVRDRLEAWISFHSLGLTHRNL
jgi:hypothetical protein